MRTFLRGELRLQLLGDWLLTVTDPATTPSLAQNGSPAPAPNGRPAEGSNGSPDLAANSWPAQWPSGWPAQGSTGSPGPELTGSPGPEPNGSPGPAPNCWPGPAANGRPAQGSTGSTGPAANSWPAHGPSGWPAQVSDGSRGPEPDGSPAPAPNGLPAPPPNGFPAAQVNGPTDLPPPASGADPSRLTAPANGSAAPVYDGPPETRPDHVFAQGYDGPLPAGDARSAATYRDGSPATYPDRSFEHPSYGASPDLSQGYSAAAHSAYDRLSTPLARQAGDGSAPTVRQIDLPAGPKNLIALLALNGRCARTHAAATLWPDCTDDVAAARLRAVLWRLRHRHVGVPPLIEIGDSSLALSDAVAVDVDRFRDGAELLIRDPDNGSTEAEDAADAVLHSAELLPGWYDDWVLAARERLQYLRLGALDALATRRRKQGRTHETLEAARAAISIEPLHESAHRTIVRTHLDNGDIVEAIKHYHRFEAMLDRELGLPPSPLFLEVVGPYLALSSHRPAHPD